MSPIGAIPGAARPAGGRLPLMERTRLAVRLAGPLLGRLAAGVAIAALGVAGILVAGSPWAGIVVAVGALLVLDALLVLRHVPAVVATIEATIAAPDPELLAAIGEARLSAAAAKATVEEAARLLAAGDETAAALATERAQVALVEGKIAAGRAARLAARERSRLEERVRSRVGLE